jgi:SAM-dependent methyltransferase
MAGRKKSHSLWSMYHDPEAIGAAVAEGRHRDIVGGAWDEIGALQASILKVHGLRPAHRLLDIGCGSLRGGIHFVQYLEPGNYWGTDLNLSLIEAGYEREILAKNLGHRLPRSNLRQGGNFDFTQFGPAFDYLLAFSVFTHLPFNAIRVCLERTLDVTKPGARFLATMFEIPASEPSWKDQPQQDGITTHGASDPYHYRPEDLFYAAAGLPWAVTHVGEFGHPRGQRLVIFDRI